MGRILWTSKEISILKENYFEISREELQRLLPNRTWKSIVKKAGMLKLKRTDNITIQKSWIYKMIDGAIYKMCPNCKRFFLLDKYHFFVDKTAKTGFKSRCKECEIEDYRFGDKIGLFNIRWSEIYCLSGIYKITNKTTGKIYIGSASNFCMRWSAHYSMLIKNKHENEYLQNAWNKYGKDYFIFEIIEFVEDKSKLLIREQYWLDFTKCYDRKIGFNIEAIAGNSYGRITSKETKEKLKRIKNKPVMQFDCKGTFVKEWISAHEINRVLGSGYSRGGIQCCCSYKTLQYRNYIWIYKEEVEQETFNIINYVNKLEEKEIGIQNRKGVLQYSLDGKLIKVWSSIKLASKELNIRDYNILQCCKKKMSSYSGYTWRFSEECSDKLIQVNGLCVKIIYQYYGRRLVKVWNGIGLVSKFVKMERKNLARKLKENGMIVLDKYTWSISEL